MTHIYNHHIWNDTKVIVGVPENNANKPSKTLIGLHGAESSPENLLIYGNKLDLNDTWLIFPEGQVECEGGLKSWWLDGPKQKPSVKSYIEHIDQIIGSSVDHVKNATGQKESSTHLWGFSQGAAASLVSALFANSKIDSICSICGFLPELPDIKPSPNNSKKILGIFGTDDDVVPSFLADHALEEMKGYGHEVIAKETSQSHEIKQDNLDEMRKFLIEP